MPFTHTEFLAVKIPMVASVRRMRSGLPSRPATVQPPGKQKVVWIKNTCALEEIVISEALLEEAKSHPQIEVFDPMGDVTFPQGEPIFSW